ncbi:hypothetical protein A3C18_00565 [Candidatus Kaiserbacteria bacterium RIFCSPHIGHO2_02_FULL_54_11b]|uniref:Type II secretion system protein GspG C-terminal domain-containing protein n=2 Tax=Candidatus Kaiseribacteriota TaxID=1752734 RepID=A0A1F6CMZ3_9BACT|nr:MAG: hypothetical protein A2704_05740 [Candidatus Kaiserbacteria bacterium RIFCSPHIGHO2_01_FULL_54_36b]OGG65067.1 MAG: hypothetical protein A3C18_00565 [Candidatus Kaiserbacteria bacterium RIFCSPHIGHO2_02_FULL_54_11b]
MKTFYKRGLALSQSKGFTLIELLVVIAIIGILSSIVLASLNSARTKGRDARRVSDIKQLQLALELYYDANSAYPAELTTAALVDAGYIATMPTDPSDSPGTACTTGAEASCYDYDQTSSGASYELGANLETSGHTALNSDAGDTVVAGGDITAGADTTSCTGGANRYCYNVAP